MLEDREKTATPTIERSVRMDESVLSGYDGDREDEDIEKEDSDDSFLEYDGRWQDQTWAVLSYMPREILLL